jgi:hypothetical protein
VSERIAKVIIDVPARKREIEFSYVDVLHGARGEITFAFSNDDGHEVQVIMKRRSLKRFISWKDLLLL